MLKLPPPQSPSPPSPASNLTPTGTTTTTPRCSVVCTGVNGSSRVDGLNLPSSHLLGNVPSDLCLIDNLRHLNLSDNSLNGTLPDSLFSSPPPSSSSPSPTMRSSTSSLTCSPHLILPLSKGKIKYMRPVQWRISRSDRERHRKSKSKAIVGDQSGESEEEQLVEVVEAAELRSLVPSRLSDVGRIPGNLSLTASSLTCSPTSLSSLLATTPSSIGSPETSPFSPTSPSSLSATITSPVSLQPAAVFERF
ncbi:hypothetical protein QJS10_CPB19g01357 [Acorus calamus]|uniref:Uncharacterized protein n=1 Tax=Acorus calamus TaxID=4465 RepID=A0AAV9CIF2_ACOCL|nr:hypothetical protein QJS10_CPB19g01357 [Acorus calamus]